MVSLTRVITAQWLRRRWGRRPTDLLQHLTVRRPVVLPVSTTVLLMSEIVGRDAVVATSVAALGNDRTVGVLVTGPVGVGKTALADAIAATFTEAVESDAGTDQIDVWRLFASRVSGQIPLGVLATNLPAEFVDSPLSPTLALKQMLADRNRDLLIMVDDANLVDDPSAEALASAATAGFATLVLTQRSGTALPQSFRRLLEIDVVTRVECTPLDAATTIELATRLAGAPMSPTDEQHVLDLTLGNPLFIRELVLAAVETGRLAVVDGLAAIDRAPVESSRLDDLVARRLADISPPARELLMRIAAAEPLGPGELAAIADDGLVEELRSRDMIQLGLDDRRVRVRVAHPLIAETLRASASPLTLREHRSVVARSVTSFGARRRDDRLRLASWSLEGGDAVPTSYLVDASRMAFAARDLERSAALARMAFTQEPSFETGRALEAPLYEIGDPEELEAFFERWVPMATNDDERTIAARCVAVARFWRGGTTDSIAELVDLSASMTDRRLEVDLLAQAAMLQVTRGDVNEALSIAEPLADEPPSAAFARLALALGHGRRAAGRPLAALALLERTSAAYRAAGPEAFLMSSMVLDGARLAALVDAGRFDELRAAAAETVTLAINAGQATAVGLAHLSVSWCDITQGLYERAIESAGEAERWLTSARHPGMVRWAIGWQALAETLRGDLDGAKASLARLDRIRDHPAGLFDAAIARSRARVAYLEGFPVQAQELLIAAAGSAAGRGNVANELMCWHDLARLGEPAEALVGVERMSAELDGEVFPAEVAHVRALAAGRSSELGKCSDRFAELGQWHLAEEAALAAAHAATQRSDVSAANRWLRRAADLGMKTERTAGNPHPAVGKLTVREREISRLAVSGLSSREIGERLFISTRTVDGHLRRTYGKLGVHGRAELADLLAT